LFESGAAEKTWQEQVARLSTDQPYQLMSNAETERLLREKLRLRISDHGIEKNYELVEFAIFLKHKSASNILRLLVHELSALATRAHPAFAPIVAEYAQVTGLLLQGKTRGVAKRLDRLETSRQEIATQMRGIDDYLNWFEATSLARPSGEFAGYMKAAERAAQLPRTRRDPISVYLDVLETQFDR
jgi:hypothetical protein